MKRNSFAAAFALLLAIAAGCEAPGEALQDAIGGGGSPGPANRAPNGSSSPSGSAGSDWKGLDLAEAEGIALKVMYASEPAFYEDLGNLFLSKYPNVEFQVIALSETRGEGDEIEEFRRVVRERQPDVLLMNETVYGALAAEGALYDLEVPIRASAFDADGLFRGVTDLLRARGSGRLYGLADSFRSKALYFNRTLFDAHGVPYPTEGMSWEDLLSLAKRFPEVDEAGEPLHGLSLGTAARAAFELPYAIGQARGLTMFAPDGSAALLDAPAWIETYREAVEAYRDGTAAVPVSPFAANGDGTFSVSVGNRNAFVAGRAAMALDDLGMMHTLDAMERIRREQGKTFEWDVTTYPAQPERPGTATEFELTSIFGIRADSPNAAAAWEFLRHVHGEETMRLRARSSLDLLSRPSLSVGRGGRDLAPFYRLTPDPAAAPPLVPKGFTKKFETVAEAETAAAIAGTVSPEEALKRIQKAADSLLQELGGGGEFEPFAIGRDTYL